MCIFRCLCPLINSHWPLSLITQRARVFASALIFFSSSSVSLHFLLQAMLSFSVKWGHCHTSMCCDKLAQRRQMVLGRRLVVIPFAAVTWIDLCAVEQTHKLHLCNLDFGYFVCTHTSHPSTLWSACHPTLHPSPLVSMMCAVEAHICCRRVFAWIRSESWKNAEGFHTGTESSD